MKAKYFIGILSAIMLTGLSASAQDYDDVYLDNDNSSNYSTGNPRIVVNNYYDDNDFYFASRINRFHRSYAVFDYYSPFYTDLYWYTYSPVSLGLSIYRGGLGFSIGYNFGYPIYYTSPYYYYDWDWYDPYYSYNYWGYDPYYYSSWYWGYYPYYRYTYWCMPAFYNYSFWGGWGHHNSWWGWNSRSRFYAWNDYRPYRYSHDGYNNYNHTSRPSTMTNSVGASRRSVPGSVNRQGSGSSISRRGAMERPSTSIVRNGSQGGRTALPGQSVNRRSTIQGTTSRNTSQPVIRRSSEIQVTRSNNRSAIRNSYQPVTRMNTVQPVARSNSQLSNTRNMSRPATQGNRPSYRASSQPSAGRRSSMSAAGPSRSSSFSSAPRSYSAPRAGGSMSQGRGSSSSSRSSSSSHSSGSSRGGRR